MSSFLLNLSTVATQVLILFIIIALGFICGKTKILNDVSSKTIADICLLMTSPAVIIKSFMKDYNSELAYSLLLSVIAAILCHIIGIAISTVMFRQKDRKRRGLFRCAATFCNATFMAMPLQLALLPEMGGFYCASYAAVFNFILWTYGLSSVTGNKEKLNIKKLVLNPGLLAISAGVIIFLFSIEIHPILDTAITYIGNINTPLPMLVLGFYLSKLSLKRVFADKESFIAILARIVIVPLACLGILYLLGFRGDLLVSTIISVSAPIAVAITMFAARYECDAELSANMCSLSTVLSIITMPLIVALTQTIA